MSEITIAGRKIGPGHPCFIVAEISANHRQSYADASALVGAAKQAGADAVKFQTFTADTMTIESDAEPFLIDWQGQRRTLYDLYKEASMPWHWQPKLARYAERLGLVWFSTPFDKTAVDFLESIGCPAYKLASFELVDTGLIRYAASKGKPIILSTGMASRAEIAEAVRIGKNPRVWEFSREPIVLKCVSGYPAPTADMNLLTITDLIEDYDYVGLSDHTPGIVVPVAAVALGACIIEKHLCLDRSLRGPDAAFSLEPDDFKAMVEVVRVAEQALGEVRYGPTESEKPMLAYRRSLFVVQDIKAGEVFMAENVRSIRPAAGLHPRHYEEVIGKRAAKDIERGTPLSWEMIAQEA